MSNEGRLYGVPPEQAPYRGVDDDSDSLYEGYTPTAAVDERRVTRPPTGPAATSTSRTDAERA
ncbi:hypothetical protein GCM10009774_33170 [Cellulomonas gelida]|uniref:Uncharacterized protein n=1 Tax=Cellulomonas gelida TaxID=1712 RepID=A0A4Y3KK98_9CELL|nr:hypothetical protein CGE01nite_20920 [Cellulomonas gelida]GGL39838.1 hypothetical protein GCM10009774_33170 [Cellulomonas gelida]